MISLYFIDILDTYFRSTIMSFYVMPIFWLAFIATVPCILKSLWRWFHV